MSNLQKVIRVATQQHGCFATFQLPEIGISKGSTYNLLHNEAFIRSRRGVYLLGGQIDTWHCRAMMHVLSSGPDALLSHESALINLGLLRQDFISLRKGEVVAHHVTLPRSSRRRMTSCIHRSIYSKDILKKIVVNSIPQVTVECAIIESARHMSEQIYSSVIDLAIRKKLTSARELDKTMDHLWPAPGRSKSRVEEIIKSYRLNPSEFARTESTLEARVLRIISKCTSSKICPQFPIVSYGRRYRIDLAIPELKIAIEVDGYQFHIGRQSFDADKIRQNDIVAAGWNILRFTATQSDEEIKLQLTPLLCDGAFK